MPEYLESIGDRFGRLILIERIPPNGNRKYKYKCKCDCGNILIVFTYNLKNGNTSSCGCLQKERASRSSSTHGMSKTKIYDIWLNMRRRCFDESNISFHNYVERGISICTRWNEFNNFFEDMGIPPKGMTLERKNNNAGYSKENCIWADRRTQANNRRSSKIIEFNNKSMTQIQWDRELNLREGQIHDRLSRGWTIERALTTPRKGF